MMQAEHSSMLIKAIAQQLGFMSCGIAKAEYLQDDAQRLAQWLSQGRQAEMAYMERHFDLRVDPQKLVPGAKSVITLLCNYYPSTSQKETAPKVARYAWGQDYHFVIREKLHQFLSQLQAAFGAVEGRGFVDSAPVLERAWAVRSGLGWVGKNGNVISKSKGSYFFIATLITDLNLKPDAPFITDHCGTCTRCLDACPTKAIVAPQVVDSRKCISYLTIELKAEQMPPPFQKRADDWLFGCDICQEVCPWNRFSKPHDEPAFKPNEVILHFSINDWMDLGATAFKQYFKDSPLLRAKWSGLLRNIDAIKK